uniref:Uncharacterized protein n=1 Tax=viral metagenome TaxID=1070528 RepID=A0A6M3XGD5_9ZZZZ
MDWKKLLKLLNAICELEVNGIIDGKELARKLLKNYYDSKRPWS